jgi:hypothetical protein
MDFYFKETLHTRRSKKKSPSMSIIILGRRAFLCRLHNTSMYNEEVASYGLSSRSKNTRLSSLTTNSRIHKKHSFIIINVASTWWSGFWSLRAQSNFMVCGWCVCDMREVNCIMQWPSSDFHLLLFPLYFELFTFTFFFKPILLQQKWNYITYLSIMNVDREWPLRA